MKWPVISIIIPTHNRIKSLERLFYALEHQTMPLHLMEVIVVADGCTDNTVHLLRSYKKLQLKYIELPGEGAAIARNRGAALANSNLLLFLDDDINPSIKLVEAHIKAHKEDEQVVIGYLPFIGKHSGDYLQLNLRSWWEEKFYKMSQPFYRFGFEDLLSGNFSVSKKLFKRVDGFNSHLKCREDYELGLRLINAGANFSFCPLAWGYHCDEVSNLFRSLDRKRLEGRADVMIRKLYPELPYFYSKINFSDISISKKSGLLLVATLPWLTGFAAKICSLIMPIFEMLHMRKKWQMLNYKLHLYWYIRGLLDELRTKRNLYVFLQTLPFSNSKEKVFDISKGWKDVIQQVDLERPTAIKFTHNHLNILAIKEKFGAEPLKSKHLLKLLKEDGSIKVISAWILNKDNALSKTNRAEELSKSIPSQ